MRTVCTRHARSHIDTQIVRSVRFVLELSLSISNYEMVPVLLLILLRGELPQELHLLALLRRQHAHLLGVEPQAHIEGKLGKQCLVFSVKHNNQVLTSLNAGLGFNELQDAPPHLRSHRHHLLQQRLLLVYAAAAPTAARSRPHLLLRHHTPRRGQRRHPAHAWSWARAWPWPHAPARPLTHLLLLLRGHHTGATARAAGPAVSHLRLLLLLLRWRRRPLLLLLLLLLRRRPRQRLLHRLLLLLPHPGLLHGLLLLLLHRRLGSHHALPRPRPLRPLRPAWPSRPTRPHRWRTAAAGGPRASRHGAPMRVLRRRRRRRPAPRALGHPQRELCLKQRQRELRVLNQELPRLIGGS